MNSLFQNKKPKKPSGIEPRVYREFMGQQRFHSFVVTYKDSDLWIGIDHESFVPEMKTFAQKKLVELRTSLEKYIEKHPAFASSFSPVNLIPGAPPIAIEMQKAAKLAETGPMAAVAGAFSEYMGKTLAEHFQIEEIAVENGGDIYISIKQNITIAVYAGKSALSNKIGLEIKAEDTPAGICTSAGTVGPSVSFGNADAVVVSCKNTALADALATKVGNSVMSAKDIFSSLQIIHSQPEISSILIICQDKIGIQGNYELKLLS